MDYNAWNILRYFVFGLLQKLEFIALAVFLISHYDLVQTQWTEGQKSIVGARLSTHNQFKFLLQECTFINYCRVGCETWRFVTQDDIVT